MLFIDEYAREWNDHVKRLGNIVSNTFTDKNLMGNYNDLQTKIFIK